jgi:hypothetical protein
MTANELLDLIDELDSQGYIDIPTDVLEKMRYIANLHNDPMWAAHLFRMEADDRHPSLSAWERNQ